MGKTFAARLLLLLLVLAASGGWLSAAEPKKVATVEGITEYQLDNGFRVLIFPDPSKPTVTVNLTVFVGSRHEGYGETGMAHLLEHMVFKGTPTHPNVPKALKDRGASFNGTTWVDRTNYFETLPASDENLEFAIRLEADRFINSFIKREDLASEMTVVRNEFEMGENSPANVLSQRMLGVAYEWHNYGKSTIGNRSDIERVPIENLQAFYKKFYQPDNAMLVVAGQFDEKKALQHVEKYFGSIPKPQRKLDKTYTEEPPQDGERLVTLRRVGDVGLVGMVYHVPAGPHEDFAAMQVLENILTTPPTGRLYKALVETKKASTVGGSAYAWHDPGVLELTASVPRGNSLDEVRDTMTAVLEEIAAKGVTDAEVERARRQIMTARERAATNTSRLAVSLSDWAAQGDWRLYFLHRDRVEKVTADQIKTVAAKYLQRNNRTVGFYIPTEKSERIAIPSTPEVKTLVQNYEGRDKGAEGEAFDTAAANIEARTKQSTLPEGIKVAILPKKTKGETVSVDLNLRYGNENNLKEYVTAASFLPQLMTRGTKKYTYQQLRDELEKQKATLRGTGGVGMASFSIETRKENLPAVLELLRQVLREPSLPAEEFEVIKRQRLAMMEQARTDPLFLAMIQVQRELSPYPKDDVRYVLTIDEQIERLKAVTLDQVKRLYEEFLGSQAGELAIVGDFNQGESLKIIGDALKGWKAKQPYARIERGTPTNLAGGKHVIKTPDKANATYQAGMLIAMKDDDPDYAALVMANYILGSGGLSSRLGDRVRQKEGLSYGVGSGFNAGALDKRATLTINAICNPENITKVEKAIQEELERLVREGVTKEELDKAKQGYLQQLKVRRANDGMLANTLSGELNAGRTMAYHVDFEKKIEALTPEQVNEAIRKHFNFKKLVIVTAGDFDKKPGGGEK